MKFHTEYVTFNTRREHEYVNMTEKVETAVRASGCREGMVLVSAMHITAGVYVNDAEQGLIQDIDEWLENIAPRRPDYRHHQTGETNGDAHLKNLVIGHEVILPITAGRLDLGPWQQVYYAEFDGRRPKRVIIKVMGEWNRVKVLKFGGSSVADGKRIEAVTGIIAEAAREERVAVVLSAMKGITDLLISTARKAEEGSDGTKEALEEIRAIHFGAVRALFGPADQASALTPLAIMCNELEEILHGVELIRECSARTMDLVMSFGERLSCRLAVSYMCSRGMPAVLVDAREIVRTDEKFGAAAVDFAQSFRLIGERLAGIEGIAVIPGFIGSTARGVTTTLGRNGSDYTASIIGAGADAHVIEIWTDVDGVLSADPRIVPDAFVIPAISSEEAMELSYFGAKVIHPYTMVPAVEKNIPILIKNSLNPAAPGTLIAASETIQRSSTLPITGIASIEGISLVNIEGGGMMGIPGFAARIFAALAREGINIIMISQASSEHTICLVFRTAEGERALATLNRELAPELHSHRIERFQLIRELLIVSVIGENMHGTPGIAGRLFSALGREGINILVIAQGSSERNISFVIEEKNHTLALRTIHEEFLFEKNRAKDAAVSAAPDHVPAPDRVSVFAPATVANVASGFDVLGFALDRPGDSVTMARSAQKGVRVIGITGDDGRLPRDPKKNTAAVAVSAFMDRVGHPFGVDISLDKRMPLSSGLGSSAASAVAAVTAVNILAGTPLSPLELLPFTMEAERVACGSAHADNVAPSLLGGFVLIRSYEPLDVVRLPVPKGLSCAVVHPHAELRTEDARRVMKKEIRLSDAIRQWGNLAALVAALYNGDLALLGRSLQDVVAEPARSLLIPGFAEVKAAALKAGALGCSISGSGPSIFALCAHPEDSSRAGEAMVSAFRTAGLESDLFLSTVNPVGPVVEPESRGERGRP